MTSKAHILNESPPGSDNPGEIAVLIVEDHATYRRALVALLSRQPGIRIVAALASGSDGVRAAAELSPDVVLMDLNMPGMNGMEAMGLILRETPGAKVIVLSMQCEPQTAAIATSAGATAYICKDEPVEVLIEAIRATQEK